MADQSSSQEKTEEATPKRLREARKKGQVSRSRDLNTIVILIGAFGLLWALQGHLGRELKGLMEACFQTAIRPDLSLELMFRQWSDTFYTYVRSVTPFLLVIFIIAFAVSFFQTGPIFSGEPMKPQFKRLNIVENVKNMFKMTTLVELLKNIAKLSLIFLLAYLVIGDNLREVVLSTKIMPAEASKVATGIVVEFLIRVFVVFVIIAIIDVFVQNWQYKKNLRMTKEEVKREYKQDEGDPLIKGQRKQLHQELAMSDTRQAVGAADVVVTNPTHLAIAVQYNEAEMAAPTVVAKGQRAFAELIKQYAEEAKIPVVQNVPLAWTLIEFDIGDEIPEELYAAVAEVLVYIYGLKNVNPH